MEPGAAATGTAPTANAEPGVQSKDETLMAPRFVSLMDTASDALAFTPYAMVAATRPLSSILFILLLQEKIQKSCAMK